MGKKYYAIKHLIVALWVLVVCLTSTQARAEGNAQVPPSGYLLLSSAPGVDLYRKDYQNGAPDYIQVVDLSVGAKVVVMHGSIVASGNQQGAYGGDNASFQRQTIRQFWQEFTQESSQPFCLSNGQFFYMPKSPSPLPFPLKKDGEILTDGYAYNEFQEKKYILELWLDHADIVELSKENLYNSSAPDIVAGLREDAEKAKNKSVGRTFVGIDDQDLDGRYEVLMLFNSRSAKPQDAADALRSFGADKVMMLDGGGSTNLICQGNVLINTDREIPQAIGITAANSIDFLAKIRPQMPYQIVTQGEKVDINLMIENKGSLTWPANQSLIKVESSNPNSIETWPLTQDILPGEQAQIKIPAPATSDSGVNKIYLSIVWNDQQSPVDPKSTYVIVIPPALNSKIAELETIISDDKNITAEKMQVQVSSWIAANMAGLGASQKDLQPATLSDQPKQNFELGNALLVPLLILPVGLFVLLFAIRKQIDEGSMRDQYVDAWDQIEDDYQDR
jgi:hypothetical protein